MDEIDAEGRSLEPAGNNLWMIFWRMRSSKGIDVNVESAIAVVSLSLSLSLSLILSRAVVDRHRKHLVIRGFNRTLKLRSTICS